MSNPSKPGIPDSTDAIQRDIAQTRADMTNTLEELQQRLTPAALKEQALERVADAKEHVKAELKSKLVDTKDNIKDSIKEATVDTVDKAARVARRVEDRAIRGGQSVAEFVRENQIPLALTGAGLIWLALNLRKSSDAPRYRYIDSYDEEDFYDRELLRESDPLAGGERDGRARRTARRVSDGTRQLAQSARDRVEGVRGEAERLAQRTGSSVRALADDAGERAAELSARARAQGQRLRGGLERAYDDNPLMVGVAVAAAGGLIGLALPTTDREAQLMGPARDGLVQEAQRLARGTLEKVEDAAARRVGN